MSNHGKTITAAGLLALEYLREYPDMPSRTMARLMRKEHPKVYPNIEDARSKLRYYRGRSGAVDVFRTRGELLRLELPGIGAGLCDDPGKDRNAGGKGDKTGNAFERFSRTKA